MENLEANSESTQSQTQNAEGTKNTKDPDTKDPGTRLPGDPGPRLPGRPDRRIIEALKRLWNQIFN